MSAIAPASRRILVRASTSRMDRPLLPVSAFAGRPLTHVANAAQKKNRIAWFLLVCHGLGLISGVPSGIATVETTSNSVRTTPRHYQQSTTSRLYY